MLFFLDRGLDIVGSGEHENEFSVSIKGRPCLDPLITCQLVQQELPLVSCKVTGCRFGAVVTPRIIKVLQVKTKWWVDVPCGRRQK